MNAAFFSFIQQFIQFFMAVYSFKKILIFFREELFKFKISFIQNNAVLFIQKIIHFFEKSRIEQGYPPDPVYCTDPLHVLGNSPLTWDNRNRNWLYRLICSACG